MKNIFFLPVLAAMACSAVSAQQVTDFRQPGDVIRVEVKFSGLDAARIKQASISLNRSGGMGRQDQDGFRNSFGGNAVNESSPNTFLLEVKIPENIATGDYLLYVNAQAEIGATQYAAGQQFQMPPFHIKNNKSFVPPTITVTERR